MSEGGPKPELRDGETIRAYLEELVRMKAPVQLWKDASAAPFETTLQAVSPITFSTTTTPALAPGQVLNVSFMLGARRFQTHGKVVTPGVFRIPPFIAQGERRAHFRAPFERTEQARVFAVEQCAETLLGGRTLLGRLLNLSQAGLRVALDELGALTGAPETLKAGDRFGWVCISGLPLTPAIHGRATVSHVVRTVAEPYAGLSLEGISEADRKNIERLVIPRLPTTFGEAFPAMKRKTDFADQPGAPTSVQVRAKAPEVVARTLEGASTVPEAGAKAPVNAVLRLRKSGKKLLLLSAHAATPAMAEAFRQDGYRQVFEAKSYQDAKALAEQARFDLLVLDMRVGSHWAKDIMEALGSHGLLVDIPVVLVVDHRNAGAKTIAESVGAAHIHERSQPYDELLGAVTGLLLD